MDQEAQAQLLFLAGVFSGVALALFATDALVAARRARAEELRARAHLVQRQLELLAQVDALAAGNAAAAA